MAFCAALNRHREVGGIARLRGGSERFRTRHRLPAGPTYPLTCVLPDATLCHSIGCRIFATSCCRFPARSREKPDLRRVFEKHPNETTRSSSLQQSLASKTAAPRVLLRP